MSKLIKSLSRSLLGSSTLPYGTAGSPFNYAHSHDHHDHEHAADGSCCGHDHSHEHVHDENCGHDHAPAKKK